MDRLLALDFRGDFLEKNRKAVRLGAGWTEGRVPAAFRLPPAAFRPRLIHAGNEALALGAVAGGCKFVAGYPMTPGSSILLGPSVDGPPLGLVFEQAEDEIAALNMAIGASYAGARAMRTQDRRPGIGARQPLPRAGAAAVWPAPLRAC